MAENQVKFFHMVKMHHKYLERKKLCSGQTDKKNPTIHDDYFIIVVVHGALWSDFFDDI